MFLFQPHMFLFPISFIFLLACASKLCKLPFQTVLFIVHLLKQRSDVNQLSIALAPRLLKLINLVNGQLMPLPPASWLTSWPSMPQQRP